VSLDIFPRNVYSQWQKVCEIEGVSQLVNTIHFLETDPNIGFAGTTSEILKTTDGGSTWKIVTKPSDVSIITDFTFKDEKKGWAAATGGDLACLQTTDGGDTWIKLPYQIGGRIAGKGIYYNKSSKRLFVSTWRSSFKSLYSTDEGSTWNSFGTTGLNGYAFLNDQVGLIGSLPQSGGDQPWLWTTNGGISWSQLSQKTECWQPLASHTGEYFAVFDETAEIYSSNDQGRSWRRRSQLPGGYATGTIIEDSCGNLYVQSTGIYVSKDRGVTWSFLGGPSNALDTRFAIANGRIFAGSNSDTAAIWVYNPPLLSTTALAVTAPTVCELSRNYSITVYAGLCGSLRLDSLSYSDTNALSIEKLPAISIVDSLQLPIEIKVKENGKVIDTLVLHLTKDGIAFDTSIALSIITNGGDAARYALSRSLINIDSVNVCETGSASFAIQSKWCDTLIVTKADIDSLRSVLGFFDTVETPIVIPPGESKQVTLVFHPKLIGDLNAKLHLQLLSKDGKKFDTTAEITVKSVWPHHTFLVADPLSFGRISLCGEGILEGALVNSGCDSLEIVKVLAPIQNGFTANSIEHVPLHSGASTPIHVRFSPKKLGVVSDSVEVFVRYPQGIVDTVFVKVGGEVVEIKKFVQNIKEINAAIPRCEPFEAQIQLRNLLSCDTLTIDTSYFEPASPLVLTGTTGKARIAPGSGVEMRLAGMITAPVQGKIVIRTGSGDTSIPVTIVMLPPKAKLAVSAASLTLPETVIGCSESKEEIHIYNTGCGVISIDSMSETHPPLQARTLLPKAISESDSLAFTIVNDGFTAQFPISNEEQITLYYHGEDGEPHAKVITVNSEVTNRGVGQLTFGEKRIISAVANTVEIPINLTTSNVIDHDAKGRTITLPLIAILLHLMR